MYVVTRDEIGLSPAARDSTGFSGSPEGSKPAVVSAIQSGCKTNNSLGADGRPEQGGKKKTLKLQKQKLQKHLLHEVFSGICQF